MRPIPTLASIVKWLVELKLASFGGPVCMKLCMPAARRVQGNQ